MNDTTENIENSTTSAKSAFGDRGTNVNSVHYGHPYAEQIIKKAEEVIAESRSGMLLLQAKNKGGIPVSVMKGNGEPGFSPQAKIIYVQVPGKTDKASPKIILQYIKALREAEQHLMGYTAPDPAKDVMEYATVMHAKNIDALKYVCKVIKELTNSSYFPVLLDSLAQIGYKDMYKVYDRDGSHDEFMDAYAGY